MDTTTNQKLVSAVGGTLEEACDCGGTHGGGAFRNHLAAANEGTKNIKIKIGWTTDAMIGGRDGTTKHPEDKRTDDTSDDGTNVQWGRGRGGIDWGSITDMAIRGVPLQNTTIKQALGT
jgi:hypothetical protein